MGACMSQENAEEEEKKKRSRAIDAKLEEDSRRLRKECKILLLGEAYLCLGPNQNAYRHQVPGRAGNRRLSSR